MLNDDAPRFSVKDIGLIVGVVSTFVFAYANLAQRQTSVAEAVVAMNNRADRQDAIIAELSKIAGANVVSIQALATETERTRDRVRRLEGGGSLPSSQKVDRE